jgi:cardiolipin synthase
MKLLFSLMLIPLSLGERGWGEVNCPGVYRADTTSVRYIPSREYFQVVSGEINNAKHSIYAVLYLFSLYPNSPQSKAMLLADALVAAQKRGVNVDIVMDKGDYSKDHGDPAEAGDNRLAYDYLTGRGVHACFADVPFIVHAKAVVIDSETVVLGSANWSESAFEKNIEANALIRSKTFATQALAELGNLPTKTLPPGDSVFVNIPQAFISDTGDMQRMVTSQDERSFDTYQLLCWAAHGKQGTISPDYDTIAHYLGISSMTREEYRRQISKTLTKLADRYNLIEFKPQYNGNAQIEIKKSSSPAAVAIPESYFSYRWSNRLDFSAKAMYLLSLYYSSVSLSCPQWSMAAQTIAQRHGLSRWFVTEGVTGLRRANLLDVIYDKVPQNNDTLRRHANIYMPLPLYDPAALDSAWLGLEKKYGKEKSDRARHYAALVYKDCDFRAVEQLIALEEKYGLKKMQKAEKIIGEKSPDNPRRTVGYFIATVEKMK